VRSADLTTSARIRDAALARFAEDGYAATSVRTIAADAGVSPALILHHFGSKDGLREACDQHVFAFFREMFSQEAQFSDESMVMVRYLMRQASEDSPRANAMVADIVELTKNALPTPTADPDMRAAVLVMLRLGPLLFNGAMLQATGADVLTPEGLQRMYATIHEITGDNRGY